MFQTYPFKLDSLQNPLAPPSNVSDMYIDNVAACEAGYIPNNPLFGLQLETEPQECSSTVCGGCNSCQGTSLPLSLHGSDFGNCLDHSLSQSNTHTNLNSFWNDEMTSFSGLEIEPLPSLFQFSPGYNRLERPINHDGCAADVLLSLKHAVVKGDSPPLCHQPNVSGYNNNQNSASLSYTVHPQMLLSPSSAAHHFYHHQNQAQTPNYGPSGYYEASQCPAPHHSMMYPSMSVNVSMNMTVEPLPNYRNPKREAIHSLNYASNPEGPMHCQWNPPPSPAVNVLYPPLLSPTYPSSATYSFTADFRPTNGGNNINLTNSNLGHTNTAAQNGSSTMEHQMSSRSTPSPLLAAAQKSYYQSSICYSTPKASPTYNTTPKLETTKIPSETGYEYEEDSNSVEGLDSKPNLCRLCGKTYARPSTLKTHLRTHSGERPYRCPDCNKSFSQAANLTAHVRTHTGQKPFRCQICDRRFSQSSSVTTHMRTHSGERPYRCKACKKAFSDSSTLTKHLRIHSGDKPYQCKLCLLRFSQSGNLNRHMRVHGNSGNMIT